MSNLVAAEIIATKILVIRGKRVMLDSDLAMLYGVKTGRLNEQVSRNIKRFPEDFMFLLTKEEVLNLKSHFATSSWGGVRKLPRVFTQEGVAMLSSVLNTERAIIEAAWVAIRKDTELRQFYCRIKARHHPRIAARKAIVAVARELTQRIYKILKEQRMYTVH